MQCPGTEGGTVRAQGKDPKSNAEDWEKEIDSSYVEDDNLRSQALEMLRQHSTMGRCTRNDPSDGTPYPTRGGTKPIRSMPYRKVPAMREMVAREVRKMLNAEFIEPASTELTSSVFIVPKKDGSLRFCVDYLCYIYRRLDLELDPAI